MSSENKACEEILAKPVTSNIDQIKRACYKLDGISLGLWHHEERLARKIDDLQDIIFACARRMQERIEELERKQAWQEMLNKEK